MSEPGLWVLDRVEDNGRAVLLSSGGDIREVPVSILPQGVREGDALRESVKDGESLYLLDQEATARLMKEAQELRSSLRKGPSGPISL